MNADETLSIDDIMALTGVGRAAVANWRARYGDFPRPVGPAKSRPLRFDKAEVLSWLESRKSLRLQKQKDLTAERLLKYMLDGLLTKIGDRYQTALTALRLCCLCSLDAEFESVATWEELKELRRPPRALTPIFDECRGELTVLESGLFATYEKLAGAMESAEVCETVLRLLFASLPANASAAYGIPGSMAGRILSAAAATAPTAPDFVYSSECALGDGLLGLSAHSSMDMYSTSISAVQIAALRLYLHGHRDLEFKANNVVVEHPAIEKSYDLVTADISAVGRSTPSFDDDEKPNGRRLSRTHSAEAEYLVDAADRLADGGYAYVMTSATLLSSRGSESIRSKLVADGLVEAIIEFPTQDPGRRPTARALWVLHRGGDGSAVLIEATADSDLLEHLPTWLAEIRSRRSLSVSHVKVQAPLTPGRSTILTVRSQAGRVPTPAGSKRDWTAIADSFEHTMSLMGAYATGFETVDSVTGIMVDKFDAGARPSFCSGMVMSVAELVRKRMLRVVQCHYRPTPQRGQNWTREVLVVPVSGETPDGGMVSVPDDYDAAGHGDVLVPIMGRHAALCVPLENWAVTSSSRVLRVTDPAAINPRFLQLSINGRWNAPTATSSGVPRRSLKELQIPLLSLADQEAFVDYITRVEELHDKARELQEQSQLLAEATMTAIRAHAES